MSAAVGASLGRYPDRLNRPMNLSTLPLSPSEANPHQAEAAYSRVAIVVARVTSSSCPGGRLWKRMVLRATTEAAHLTRAVVLNLFKGAEPQDRSMTTHRTPQGVIHNGRLQKLPVFLHHSPCPQVSGFDQTHLPFPCGRPHLTLNTGLTV